MTSRQLTIKRFKCFENLDLQIENLTVLTGRNGVGKSTITQAIRLMKEAAICGSRSPAEIHLNSGGFLLGTFGEIISGSSGDSVSDSFELGLIDGEKRDVFLFTPAEDVDECEYVKATASGHNTDTFFSNLTPWHFAYLSADREGPRLHQERTDGHRSAKVGVGSKGEYSAEVLSNNETTRIDIRLCHKDLVSDSDEPNRLLKSNLEKWMSTVVGEIGIRAYRPPRLSAPYIEFLLPGRGSEWQFPTNHGFGISYTLPIILAGLTLEEGGVLIIDTPEAHLHPAAQTAVATFLARVAASNRTVIVETHSDHIIDGFRLAIADRLHPLNAANTVFHYFDRSENSSIDHTELIPRLDGSMPRWPKGFFDQFATNLRKLQELNKSNAA
jgi:predicted ATPase